MFVKARFNKKKIKNHKSIISMHLYEKIREKIKF
jgi:hypothetical protein